MAIKNDILLRAVLSARREAASGRGNRGSRGDRGAVLMEVVFAMVLFFVAGAFVMDGLNGAIRGINTIKLDADAADLAVTTFSEVQMGLTPLESVGPVGVAYAGAEGWTYELVVTALEDTLDMPDLKKLLIIIRNDALSFTYTTTHLVWDNPNPAPAVPGVDQIPGGDLAGMGEGDLAGALGALGGAAGGGGGGGAAPAFPGGGGGGGGGRGGAGDATPQFPQGGRGGGDATPRFPQGGRGGAGDATPQFPQGGRGGAGAAPGGRGGGGNAPQRPAPPNIPNVDDQPVPPPGDGQRPQRGGGGGQRGGGGGGQRGGGGGGS